jgi:hypothetical protein
MSLVARSWLLGRQRSNNNGVYGYLDGLTASYPITDKFAVSVSVGSLAIQPGFLQQWQESNRPG